MFDSLRKKISNAINSITKSESEEKPAIEAEQEKETNQTSETTMQESTESNNNEKAMGSAETESITEVMPVEEETEKIAEETGTESYANSNLPVGEKGTKQKEAITTGKPGYQAQNKPNTKNSDIKLSFSTKLKSVFSKEVSLGNAEVEKFTSELMVTMLQSDVSYSTTEKFIESLKSTLLSSKFSSREIKQGISDCVRSELDKVLQPGKPKQQLLEIIKSKLGTGMSPVSVMFLGPNGTGKTTTMAKIAYLLKQNGINAVFSASDTFRAAAIEQTAYHAEKLGIPVIKGSYGADPASIAFDAIQYAKAHSIGVVLIDTAGRQETNKNLLNEIKKMERVAKPDITIYIGESTAGNRIAEQVSEFLKYIKIDGIILTKLDCDAKGGNAISLSDVTGLPIFFFGTGESYESLIPFDPSFIIDSLVPN